MLGILMHMDVKLEDQEQLFILISVDFLIISAGSVTSVKYEGSRHEMRLDKSQDIFEFNEVFFSFLYRS